MLEIDTPGSTSHAPNVMKLNPNYFFGFRITNPMIHGRVKEVQDRIIAEYPQLKKALIDFTKLHITMGVMRLENEEDIDKVKKLTADWETARIATLFETPIQLEIQGVNFFKGNVLYADVMWNESYDRLCSVSQELKSVLEDGGYPGESRKFNPHLTIMKLSKSRSLFKHRKEFTIACDGLKNSNYSFGLQHIENIQLLSMLEKTDDYYRCRYEIKLPQAVNK